PDYSICSAIGIGILHCCSIIWTGNWQYRRAYVLLGKLSVFCIVDEEILVAEDDASLVKQIGQSFWYSKIESVLFLVNIHASSMYGRLNIDRIHFLIKARREEQIQAAHDEAMFGASALPPPTSTDSEPERENEKKLIKK
ncbi:hypothetical protein S83_055085, partial [Arachis hypogaea]